MGTESRFKPGDKVRFIAERSAGLVTGEIYTVSHRVGPGVAIVGQHPTHWWYESKFEPAPACPPADPVVAEQPKVDPYKYQKDGDYLCESTIARFMRTDSDIAARNEAARQRTIAALAAEHTRAADSAGLLHPRSWWSNRLRGGRRAR